MGLFTKFLAGGLGFALGGPLGALIGVALASIVDATTSQIKFDSTPSPEESATVQGDFRVSLLVMIAAVMKADGKVVQSELDAVGRFLRNTFGEASAQEALQILHVILRQQVEVEHLARQIGYSLNYSQRMQLLHMLYEVACADGAVHHSERTVLHAIATYMRIANADLQSIEAMFATAKDPDWAYKVLEISETSTNDDVKRAYRRMAMKYHPDKVNTLGDEVKQSATEKFRKVNEAYEHIKQARNIY
ncbi:MAG: TerB family tellurite resistance protein [Prevotellaceae bacterium]|jgi:DnaJ like chaperone protein|nr:TerB family tellurite resistance protein [Prevotellaceae bacterium]